MIEISVVLLALLAGALVYSLLSIVAASRYLSVQPPATASTEPVSILKPLAGLDEGLESNLRSFFEQDYPSFEILFAVRDRADPAVAVVEKLQAEYRRVPTRLLVTGEPPYPNAKVFSLSQMLATAENDLLVMSDSDIRVTPDFLRKVSAEFGAPNLGVATCPYRAVPGASLWSRLEATGMNTDFIAGILVARMLEGMKFAVGPTIVARKRALQEIGGFDRLKDYLAEDFVMGKFAAEAGYGVILSSYVIEHHIGSADLAGKYRSPACAGRAARGARARLAISGSYSLCRFPLALLVCAARPEWWPVLPVALLVRFLAAYVVSARVLRAKINWLLLPLEDLIGLCRLDRRLYRRYGRLARSTVSRSGGWKVCAHPLLGFRGLRPGSRLR